MQEHVLHAHTYTSFSLLIIQDLQPHKDVHIASTQFSWTIPSISHSLDPSPETPRHIRKQWSSCPTRSAFYLASGLSWLHLVPMECAYQSHSGENEAKQPGTLVAKRLVQACDMSSTSGLTQIFKFLSAGNFYQTIIPPQVHPLLQTPDSHFHPTLLSAQSISIH